MKTKRLAVLWLSLVLVVVACASAYAAEGAKVTALKQISLTIPDEPGSLNKMTQVIAEHNINIDGLNVGKGNGLIMLMVNDAAAASAVLAEGGFANIIEDVLAIEFSNVPGSMNALLANFTKAELNIEYMYLANSADNTSVYYIFGFKDVDKAISVLKEAGAEIK